MKMDQVTKAATELNTVLGCKPPIPTAPGTKKADILVKITEAATLIQEGDNVSNDTRAVIAFAANPEAAAPPAAPAAPEGTPEGTPAPAPTSTAKTVKQSKPKSEYGHALGSLSGQIDVALIAHRGTVTNSAEIAKVVTQAAGKECTAKRIIDHAKSLNTRKLAEVDIQVVNPEEGEKYHTVKLA